MGDIPWMSPQYDNIGLNTLDYWMQTVHSVAYFHEVRSGSSTKKQTITHYQWLHGRRYARSDWGYYSVGCLGLPTPELRIQNVDCIRLLALMTLMLEAKRVYDPTRGTFVKDHTIPNRVPSG